MTIQHRQHLCGLIPLIRGIIPHICTLTSENGEIDQICRSEIRDSQVLQRIYYPFTEKWVRHPDSTEVAGVEKCTKL
jgi:hypothetical protein